MNKTHLYKSLVIIVLLVAVLLQTFNKGLLFADYYSNTSVYAKDCENNLKPALKCRGRCQIIKKISQEEKENNQSPGRNAENKYESQVQYISLHAEISIFQVQDNPAISIIPDSIGQVIDRSMAIFHPPRT